MRLKVLNGPFKDTIFKINKSSITIGRKKEQDIYLPDDIKLSRCHCQLVERDSDYLLTDLNSGNGTWYKGEKVASISLKIGDTFQVGNTEFCLLENQTPSQRLSLLTNDVTNRFNISGVLPITQNEVRNDDIETLKTKLTVFREVSRTLVGKLNMQEFLEAVVENITKITKAERAFVFLLDKNNNLSDPVIIKNYSSNILISETILKKCILEKVALLIQDTQNYDDLKNRDSIKKSFTRSAVCVPLVYKDNVIAIIYLDATIENVFKEEDLKLVIAITNQASIAVENIKLYEELDQKHSALKNAQEHLIKNEKLSIIGTLATSISHDMKNILTPILGVSSLVLKNPSLNPQLKESFERQIQRLQSLTQQILSLVESHPTSFQIGQINEKLKESLDLLQTEARYQETSIETFFDEKIGPIRADFNRLDQVFINIALNAIQAVSNQKNGILKVTTKDEPEYIQITFEDNGSGIPSEYKNLIFEPFFTTKENGTGMGLFSCKKIIEEDHKGTLEIQSTTGKGTSFIIKLYKKNVQVL